MIAWENKGLTYLAGAVIIKITCECFKIAETGTGVFSES